MNEEELEFDLLLEAFENYREAKVRRDAARQAYEGYSWGYHGASEEDRLTKSRREVSDALRVVVRNAMK